MAPRKSSSVFEPLESLKSDEFLDTLNKFLSENTPAFELSGPIKAPVCLQNNTYKSASLVGNEQFMIKRAYRGGKGQIIFEGTPIDAQPYKHVDFAEKIAFHALVGFDMEIARAFGFAEGGTTLEPDDLWDHVKLTFAARLKAKKIETKKIEAEKINALYVNNPNWGMF